MTHRPSIRCGLGAQPNIAGVLVLCCLVLGRTPLLFGQENAADSASSGDIVNPSALDPASFIKMTVARHPGGIPELLFSHRVVGAEGDTLRGTVRPRGVLMIEMDRPWLKKHLGFEAAMTLSIRGRVSNVQQGSRDIEIPGYSEIGEQEVTWDLDVQSAGAVLRLMQQGARFAHRFLTAFDDTKREAARELLPREMSDSVVVVSRRLFFRRLTSDSASLRTWLEKLDTAENDPVLDIVGSIVSVDPDILRANATHIANAIAGIGRQGVRLEDSLQVMTTVERLSRSIVDLEREIYLHFKSEYPGAHLDSAVRDTMQSLEPSDCGTNCRLVRDTITSHVRAFFVSANYERYRAWAAAVQKALLVNIRARLVEQIPPTYVNLGDQGLENGDRLIIEVSTLPRRDGASSTLGQMPFEFEVVREGWSGLLPQVTDVNLIAKGHAEPNWSYRPGVATYWNYYGRHGILRALSPGFGFSVLFLEFRNQVGDSLEADVNPLQIGLGPSISLFNNTIWATVGWNLQKHAVVTNSSGKIIRNGRRYLGIGFSLAGVVRRIQGG